MAYYAYSTFDAERRRRTADRPGRGGSRQRRADDRGDRPAKCARWRRAARRRPRSRRRASTSSARSRDCSRPTRHRRVPADDRAVSASGSTTTGGCPALLRAVTSDEIHAAAAEVARSRRVRRSPSPARSRCRRAMTQAVFFDVDFTLIHPGPTFQGAGYRDVLRRARHRRRPGGRSTRAVAAAAASRSTPAAASTIPRSSSATRAGSSRAWAARGRASDDAARDIYDEWSACHHFTLYEDVPDVLREIHARGVKIGLISNTQRCLTSFQTHFELDGLFSVDRVVRRPRLHEAAPEHLRGGAGAGRRRARRSR